MAYQKLTPIIATGSSAPRYLGDRCADVVNVLDFGAVGDGTTDDAVSFAAAVTAGNGRAVFIPSGTYLLSEDVSGTFYSFGDVSFTGAGSASVINVLDVAELENYVQNSVVHLTGNEYITGVKHFTSTPGDQDFNIAIHIPNYTAGQNPQQDVVNGISFKDSSGSATPVGDIHHGISTSGTRGLHFHLYDLSGGDSLTGFSVMATTYDKRFAPTGAGEMYLGTSANRWKTIYSVNALNTSSDERIKTFVSKIPDTVLDAWGEVGFVQYKLKSSIEKKGENARLHNGLVAQRIDSVFKAHGIDVSQYGLFCYDSWESSPAEYDSNGNLVKEARDAGDEFSLRYEEALCMEAAYQRRRADRLEARLAELEERVNQLTNNQNS